MPSREEIDAMAESIWERLKVLKIVQVKLDDEIDDLKLAIEYLSTGPGISQEKLVGIGMKMLSQYTGYNDETIARMVRI